MGDHTPKAALTVAEMAGMCGLSRARFYQLVEAGVFPPPVYCVRTRRPLYDEGLQAACLGVRRYNRGIDGRPVLFYGRRPGRAVGRRPSERSPKSAPEDGGVAGILAGLGALGLTTATVAQVRQATGQLFPSGVVGVDEGEVLRRIFLHLRQQSGS